MAKTESTMLPLGTMAPRFVLQDVATGKMVSLVSPSVSFATVVMFICNHCPYVKHTLPGIITLTKDYADQNIQWIAINSNDITQYPDDSPEQMARLAKEQAFSFPYLFDETQEVAKAYHAACTPDFFVFNQQLSLVYRGQLDDSRPGNGIPVTGDSIRAALTCMLNKQPVSKNQKPSLGCNIKWRDHD